MVGNHLLRHRLGVVHVAVVVAVVAHDADGVLPGSGIVVACVADGLVNQNLSLVSRAYWESSDGHVRLVGRQDIGPFAVVHQTIVVVADVAVGSAEGVLALVAEQEVIRRIVLPVGGQHTVVPGAVAEEQQESWHVGLRLRTVVEHLQIASVGIGVGRAAGELVEEFVGRYDADA